MNRAKQSLKKDELDEFWEKAAALGPESIGKALFCESTLGLLRREIRRGSGLLIDSEDLAKSLHEMLSQEARDLVGPLRIRKKRRSSRRNKSTAVSQPSEGSSTTEKAAPPEDVAGAEPE